MCVSAEVTEVTEETTPAWVEDAMDGDLKSPGPFSISASSLLDESSLDGRHLVVQCLLGHKNEIATHALTDCGASGFAFVDEQFARQHNLPRYQLRVPRALEVIDGRPISSGDITEVVRIPMTLGGHREDLPAFVTSLGQYPLVLGIPWLNHHGVVADFAVNTLTFSDRCKGRCMQQATTIQGSPPIPPKNPAKAPEREKAPVPPAEKAPDREQAPEPISIAAIGPVSFRRMLTNKGKRYGDLQTFQLSLYQINQALAPAEDPAETEDEKIKRLVPEEFHDFLPLFREAVAHRLPPHRPTADHSIPFKDPNWQPPFGPIYSLSRFELEALKEWLEKNLKKGFIRSSSSPAGSPILFTKKGDGKLRLCVDYRGLNEGTIKNRYPLPLIQETLMRLARARWFTKLDVRDAYNLIRIVVGEEWKTAFRTRMRSGSILHPREAASCRCC